MNEELKPCPFCGGTNTMKQSVRGTMQHATYHWIHCEDCDAQGPVFDFDKPPEESWNTRPGEDALREELENMRARAKSAEAELAAISVVHGACRKEGGRPAAGRARVE